MLSFPRSFFSTCFVCIAPSQKKNMGSTKKSVYVDVLQCWNGSDSFLGKHLLIFVQSWNPNYPPWCLEKTRRKQWYDTNHLFVLTTKDIGRFSFQWNPPDFSFFVEDGRPRPSGGGVISRYNHLKTVVTCQGFPGILATQLRWRLM